MAHHNKPDKPEKDREKRPYRKPAVKQVPLRPDEAVLGGCKSNGQYGPALSNCNLSGTYCFAQIS